MWVRTLPSRCLAPISIGVGLLFLAAACGGQEVTVSPTATLPLAEAAPSSATPLPQPTETLKPIPTPRPTATPARFPAVTAVPTNPTAMPPPTPLPTTAPLPMPATVPSPSPLAPTAGLLLEVTSPVGDMIVASDTVTVAGFTSADATLSVNGDLVTPDGDGNFSVEVTISPEENPLAIEIIATSITGDQQSVVRTVIFIPDVNSGRAAP